MDLPAKNTWEKLIEYKKNIVFLGEAGCGKSEIAINLAMYLKEKLSTTVHLFDLDQTKPLFRSRDVKEELIRRGVDFHYEEQFEDAPTLVGGVIPAMLDEENHVILDVGGDKFGARLIGRFAHLLNRDDTAVFYVINPYRAFSGTQEDVIKTMINVTSAARVRKIEILANPNLGQETTAEDIEKGLCRVFDYIGEDFKVKAVIAMDNLAGELPVAIKDRQDISVISIKRYMTNDWLE